MANLSLTPGRQSLGLLVMAVLAACGGSGGGDNPPANRPPTANAGSDQTVAELTVVNLLGSATDPEMGAITYAWVQTAGQAVTLATPDAATASFTAPDVAPGMAEVLTFTLTATDAGGLSATDSVNVTVQEPAAVVTISGTLRYEFPPPNANCSGLNFLGVELRPIRQASVQLLDETGTRVIDSDVSDDLGQYSVTVNASTNVILRVRAETRRAGNVSWDVQVRNNVDTSGSPPPLSQRPLYVMDSAVFDSGTLDQTRNLTAETGWGVTNYTGPRVAAPFAILDTIYSAILFVAAEDPSADFPPLDAFWSPDNKSASPTDVDAGDLPTSYYDGQEHLFLLGLDGSDTEEFDDHVIVHEWGHYFEDNFSRTDSIGGRHSVTSGNADKLDMRVAFGEGWATALSGMALGDPLYCDTSWFGPTQSGFALNIESRDPGTEGWFNEVSILQILYDLWDARSSDDDGGSVGFGPIYQVMTGPQAATPAFTSIFTFATYLKQQVPGQATYIDNLLTSHNIVANGIEIYASTELNAAGATEDVFPLYTDVFLGTPETICVNSQFDSGRDGNKLSESRYLRLTLNSNRQVSFTMNRVDPPPTMPSAGYNCQTAPDTDPEIHEHSDPDFLGYRNGGLYVVGLSCEPNSEVESNVSLAAGTYVFDINDYRHADDETPVGYPERVCFEFTAN